MKRNESKLAGYNGERIKRTNTHQLELCPSCNCMTQILMDDDGNRYCGKCKQLKLKGI